MFEKSTTKFYVNITVTPTSIYFKLLWAIDVAKYKRKRKQIRKLRVRREKVKKSSELY